MSRAHTIVIPGLETAVLICPACEQFHVMPLNSTLVSAPCNPALILNTDYVSAKAVFSALKGRDYDIKRKRARRQRDKVVENTSE
jgi:hypothetical protein